MFLFFCLIYFNHLYSLYHHLFLFFVDVGSEGKYFCYCTMMDQLFVAFASC